MAITIVTLPLFTAEFLYIWEYPTAKAGQQLAGHIELFPHGLLFIHQTGVVWDQEYHTTYAWRCRVQVFSLVDTLVQSVYYREFQSILCDNTELRPHGFLYRCV